MDAVHFAMCTTRKRLRGIWDRSHECSTLTNFHSRKIPSREIGEYWQKLTAQLCEPSEVVLAGIYLDRLYSATPHWFDAYTMHRIVLTAVGLALKFHRSKGFSAKRFCKYSGAHCEELRRLESDFCNALNHRLFVTEAEYATQLGI